MAELRAKNEIHTVLTAVRSIHTSTCTAIGYIRRHFPEYEHADELTVDLLEVERILNKWRRV